MSKNIKTIMITGGPCAGKSTSLIRISEEISKLGYTVLTVNETATQLINGGVNIQAFGERLPFQRYVFKLQLLLEDFYKNEVTKDIPSDKILIVCDRGLIDTKAFLSDEDFDLILKENHMTLNDALNRYDAVFHLVTAADGAEEFYTLSNNNARNETKDEAFNQDKRLIECYKGNKYFKVIKSAISFEDKVNNLINEIKIFLNEKN